MPTRFYDAPGHAGYCMKHSRWGCASCKKLEKQDERKAYDYGLFHWRSDGIYTRGTALRIFKSEAAAKKAADRRTDNVVVRTVRK